MPRPTTVTEGEESFLACRLLQTFVECYEIESKPHATDQRSSKGDESCAIVQNVEDVNHYCVQSSEVLRLVFGKDNRKLVTRLKFSTAFSSANRSVLSSFLILENAITYLLDERQAPSRFIGPFEILERMGEVSYRLALPPQLSHVHDVFHISLLRGYHYHPLHVASYLFDQIQPDMSFVRGTESILDGQERVMRHKVIPFVKSSLE
ncbi:hypothetical protein Tco_0405291 [Tanacetum coccineum]